LLDEDARRRSRAINGAIGIYLGNDLLSLSVHRLARVQGGPQRPASVANVLDLESDIQSINPIKGGVVKLFFGNLLTL
jgi:hypothetical protein